MDLNKTTMGSQQMLNNEIQNNQLEHAALMIRLFGYIVWPKELHHLSEASTRSDDSCPKGGRHEWGIDGAHSNEFCKKCFISSGG